MNPPNPIQHFHQWFCDVKVNYPEVEVNALGLTTFGLDGFPKTRMVLLKQYTWEGFIFYSQYTSDKGKSIAAHPKVSLFFPWEKARKRIYISGIAEKITKEQSEAYFESRPRGSQIGAWASHQSEPISSREALEKAYDDYELKFQNQSIPKPARWGGYLVKPVEFSFEEIENTFLKQIHYTLINNIDWTKNLNFIPE